MKYPLVRGCLYLAVMVMVGLGLGLATGLNVNLAAVESAKPINTICPVSGKPIDPAIAPVVVTMGKGDRAQRVVIGVADAAAADKVKANPEIYAPAAKANKQADKN